MFVNIKIKHFMLIKYSKKSHKIKNSKRTFLIYKKTPFGVYFIFGDEYGIRIRECCRERAVC